MPQLFQAPSYVSWHNTTVPHWEAQAKTVSHVTTTYETTAVIQRAHQPKNETPKPSTKKRKASFGAMGETGKRQKRAEDEADVAHQLLNLYESAK